MNAKYTQMIQAYTKGDNATARALALELAESGMKDASKMRDVFHVLLRTQ